MNDRIIRYLTVDEWAREVKLPVDTLASRLRYTRAVVGPASDGMLTHFFGEDDINRACPELFTKRLGANNK